MRRPRNKLEVSTFPFLAVLLCAMGSLILILMVFDRRAKLAANERNRMAFEGKKTDRVAEINKLQQNHQDAQLVSAEQSTLAKGKFDELVSQGKNLESKEEEIRNRLLQTQRKWEALDKWIRESRMRVDNKKERNHSVTKHLEMERHESQEALKKLTEKERELAELNSRLVALKKLLLDLKAGGLKPAESYSIVPYFGKRGESRKPIYVECAAGGVVFHPGVVAFGPEEGASIREELYHRARLLQENEAPNGSVPPTPFLLLLVRPEGIESYWKLQKLLRSDKVDFGYELIDGDWKLDFPDDARLVKGQTQTLPRLGMGNGTGYGMGNQSSGLVSQGVGSNQRPGSSASGRTPGLGTGIGSDNPNDGGGAGSGLPGTRGSNPAMSGNSAGQGGPGGGSGRVAVGGPGGGSGRVAGEGPGGGGTGSLGEPEDPAGLPGIRGIQRPGQNGLGTGPNSVAGQGLGTGQNLGSGQEGLTGNLPGSLGPQGNFGQNPIQGNGPSGPASPGGASPGGESPGGTQKQGVATGKPGGKPENLADSGNANRATPTASQGGELVAGGAAGFDPRLVPDRPQKELSEEEKNARKDPGKRDPTNAGGASGGQPDGDPPNPFARVMIPLPRVDSGEKPEPRPLRIGRLEGEREYTIYVECRAKGLVMQPEGLQIPGQDLETEEGAKRFVEMIRRQIDKKNRANREGEPPIRGKLKFLVWGDGVRWFHASFPLVEGLDIVKVRQNLDPEDSIRDILLGR